MLARPILLRPLLSLAATCVAAGTGTLQAQPAGTPKFDVASVKLHVRGGGLEPQSCSKGRFVSIGLPLDAIILWAYDLDQNQFVDMRQHLPKWLFPHGETSALSYDIEAKSAYPLTEAQCKTAVQALLADRFKFSAHWESKAGTVYELVIARGGPKMQKASDADTERGVAITINGRPVASAPGATLPAGETMPELAALLSLPLRQPVVDKTGLEGRYKFALRFSIQSPAGDQAFADPDLDTALQQQLGLKLETKKGPVKTLRVDRIEPPIAN